jgi:DNA primase
MEIKEIKSRLSILDVLSHYGLKPDKNKMLCCPFHEDKTPSMQVYPETNTVFCFSGNCKLHSKAIDPPRWRKRPHTYLVQASRLDP